MDTIQGQDAGAIHRFLVDQNVGKLARWLRLLGYDAENFSGANDGDMVRLAIDEDRMVLTRDTAIRRRRVVTFGRLKVLTFETENAGEQMRQLLAALPLLEHSQPYTRCLECNARLRPIDKSAAGDRVPRYTFDTQTDFMECPACKRIYWRGSHWQALERRLADFKSH